MHKQLGSIFQIMTLRDWVYKNGGPEKISRQLKTVGAPAVRMWLLRKASPRPLVMQQIFNLSKGKVTYRTMVEETLREPKRAKRS